MPAETTPPHRLLTAGLLAVLAGTLALSGLVPMAARLWRADQGPNPDLADLLVFLVVPLAAGLGLLLAGLVRRVGRSQETSRGSRIAAAVGRRLSALALAIYFLGSLAFVGLSRMSDEALADVRVGFAEKLAGRSAGSRRGRHESIEPARPAPVQPSIAPPTAAPPAAQPTPRNTRGGPRASREADPERERERARTFAGQLSSDDLAVRRAAAVALAGVGAHAVDQAAVGEATNALVAALVRGDIQHQVARALGRVGEPALAPLLAALDEGVLDLVHVTPALRALGSDTAGRAAAIVVERLLATDDGREHAIAARAMRAIGPAGIEPLLAHSGDPRVVVRARVLSHLGAIGGQAVVEPLVDALGDENVDVRRAAERAVIRIGDIAAPALVVAIADADPRRSAGAASALHITWRRLDRSTLAGPAAEAVRTAMREGRLSIREAAPLVEDLRASAPELTTLVIETALFDENRKERRSAASVVRRLNVAALPQLLTHVEHERADVRGRVIELLGAIKSSATERALLRALGDDDELVRNLAQKALGGRKSTALPALVSALGDSDANTRAGAARALWTASRRPLPAGAVPALLRALEDPSAEVRGNAARALGGVIGGGSHDESSLPADAERVVEGLAQMLRDDASEEARLAAAAALSDLAPRRLPGGEFLKQLRGRLSGPSEEATQAGRAAVPFLLEALRDDPSVAVRRTAIFALLGLAPDSPELLPALRRSLRQPELASWAASALETLGKEAASSSVPALIDAMSSATSQSCNSLADAIVAAGTSTLPALIEALKAEPASTRHCSAMTLAHFAKEASTAVPALLVSVHDSDPTVRAAVAAALGGTGSGHPGVVPALIGLLGDDDPSARGSAAWALGTLGDEAAAAVPELLDCLHDGRLDRGLAFVILGSIGEPSAPAIPDLLAALEGSDESLAGTAAQVLSAVGAPAAPGLVAGLARDDAGMPLRRQALRTMGEPAVPALVQGLRQGLPPGRLEAARLLGALRERARGAVPALQALAGDEHVDADLRETAAQALRDIDPTLALEHGE